MGSVCFLLSIIFTTFVTALSLAQSSELRELQSEVHRLFKERRYTEAVPRAHKALDLAEQEYGLRHPTTGTFVFNLGKLYQLEGDYNQATLYFRRALDVRATALGMDHPDVAASYFGLGQALSHQCEHEGAEKSFNGALQVMERALAENPHVVNNLSRTAHIYRAHAFQNRAKLRHLEGKHVEADHLYGASVRMLQSLLGERHVDLALAFISYANLLQDMGRADEARDKRALAETILAETVHKKETRKCAS